VNKTRQLIALIQKNMMLKNIATKLTFAFFFTTIWLKSWSQTAEGLFGADAEPIEWNLFNIVLFIVLPILLIIIYIWHRKRKNKK
jgi:hypothetical protein